jgi:hypothetical protein
MDSLANIIISVWELLADEEFKLLLSFTEGKDASRILGSISFKKLCRSWSLRGAADRRSFAFYNLLVALGFIISS